MAGTYGDLTADIVAYTTYDSDDFVAQIPSFVREAEERIWYFVQIPNYRRNVTGSFDDGDPYLALPTDFLAAASLAVISALGVYTYLLNKDPNFIREVFPNPATTGVPYCYGLFDNATIIIGPSPDASYSAELNYYYKPASLTVGDDPANTTWLSLNAYDTLLYGALTEASTYLKKNSGVDNMGDEYEKRFVIGVKNLQNLGESRDRKDTYRAGEKRRAEN